MGNCPHRNCFAPDTGCALGEMELSKCSEWTGAISLSPENAVTGEKISLPWSGNTLGLSDLDFVTGRSKPIILGLVGTQSAGKTTLLASWYLLLGRGALADKEHLFAGSYTLAGWESVASPMRWKPGQPPRFPPHTTSGGARTPGILHFSFREKNGRLSDFFFADAPGEWFQKWAINAESPEAEGARWISRHADTILLIADRQALSGPSLGSARNAFQLLTTRVAAERHGRPVALVWTKADVDIKSEMEATIRNAVMSSMPDAAEFSVGIFSKDGENSDVGFRTLFDWILRMRRQGMRLPPAASSGNDPLFVFGRR